MKKFKLTLIAAGLFLAVSSCNNYGTEKIYNGVELYHTQNITDAEAGKLGDYLVSSKFADGTTKTVQITKQGNTYQFRFVLKDGADKDPSLPKTLKYMASILSARVFNGQPVEVHMCDDQLKTLKVFTGENYGKEKVFDGVELFHTQAVTDAEADSLGNYLVTSKFADGNEKTVQLAKPGSIYQFRFVVKEGLDKDQNFLNNVKSFAAELSKNVFQNAPVEVHLCDNDLTTIAVVPMDNSNK
jgi:hypothetical protein